MEKRYVFGTRSKKWHLVGPDDRDYKCGITQAAMKRIGKSAAKKKYLAPNRICRYSKTATVKEYISFLPPKEKSKLIRVGFYNYIKNLK